MMGDGVGMTDKGAPGEIENRLEISCPHCGGISSWKLLQSLNRCAYCGSVLYRAYREDAPQYLVAESTVQSDPQIIDVLATYDAMREVSRRRADFHSYDDTSAVPVELGSGFADTEVYQVKEERKHLFRLLECYPLHVPYLLLYSTLVFHALGRVSNASRKIYRSFFFTSEDVKPAYRPPWDFRDRGLVVSLQKLKPFDPDMQKESRFLDPLPIPMGEEDPGGPWIRQSSVLMREMDPIYFKASVVQLRRWIVFRPYAYVRAQTPDGMRWYLIDKQFGTFAGDPRTDELDRVQGKNLPVVQVGKDLLLEVKAIPFRCPECGWDMEMNARSIYQICVNCTRLLESTEQGLQECSYRVLESVPWKDSNSTSSAWLPFWACKLRITLEGKTYDDISLLINNLIPPSPIRKVDLPENWETIYIPAFESWTYDRYDEWAFQTAIRLSGSDADSPSSNLLQQVKQQNDEIIPPAYNADMVRSLFPRVLPFYFPAVLHSQLNMMLLNRVAQMRVQFESTELVYFPLPLKLSGQDDLRLVSSAGEIEYQPVKTGQWPLVLQRSVRTWKAMAEDSMKR